MIVVFLREPSKIAAEAQWANRNVRVNMDAALDNTNTTNPFSNSNGSELHQKDPLNEGLKENGANGISPEPYIEETPEFIVKEIKQMSEFGDIKQMSEFGDLKQMSEFGDLKQMSEFGELKHTPEFEEFNQKCEFGNQKLEFGNQKLEFESEKLEFGDENQMSEFEKHHVADFGENKQMSESGEDDDDGAEREMYGNNMEKLMRESGLEEVLANRQLTPTPPAYEGKFFHTLFEIEISSQFFKCSHN